MAYEGYLNLGGTEIANAARTEAYVDTQLSAFGLQGCQDCEGLAQALGDVARYDDRIVHETLSLRTNYARNPRPIGTPSGNTVPLFATFAPATGETGGLLTLPNPNFSTPLLWDTNYALNPVFKTGDLHAVEYASGWSGFLATTTTAQAVIPDVTTAINTFATASGSGSYYFGQAGIPVTPGEVVSMGVLAGAGSGISMNAQIRWLGTAGTVLSTVSGTAVTVGPTEDDMVWLTATGTAPAGTLTAAVTVGWSGSAGSVSASATAFLVRKGAPGIPAASDFFMGTNVSTDLDPVRQTYYIDSWTGAENNSSSERWMYAAAQNHGEVYEQAYVRWATKTPGTSARLWSSAGAGLPSPVLGPQGEQVTVSIWARQFGSTSLIASLRPYVTDAGGTAIVQGLKNTTLPQGQWVRIEVTFNASVGYRSVHWTLGFSGARPRGSFFDLSGLLIEKGPVGTYFDGSLPDSKGIEYAWGDDPNTSTSTVETYTESPVLSRVEPGTDTGYNQATDPRTENLAGSGFDSWSYVPAAGDSPHTAARTSAPGPHGLPGSYSLSLPSPGSLNGSLRYENPTMGDWVLGADQEITVSFQVISSYTSAQYPEGLFVSPSATMEAYDGGGRVTVGSAQGDPVNVATGGAWVPVSVVFPAGTVTGNPWNFVADLAILGEDLTIQAGVFLMTEMSWQGKKSSPRRLDGTSSYGDYIDDGFTDTLTVGWGDSTAAFQTRTEWQLSETPIYDRSYRTPIVDNAPWMDSSNPDLANFWGFYPLSATGLDDGTRQVAVTELLQDGAIVGGKRKTSREIRFDGLLLGENDAAVDAGLAWLNRALDATTCDAPAADCNGVDLSFFSTCPPVCEWGPEADSPLAFSFIGKDPSVEIEDPALWQTEPSTGEWRSFVGSTTCNGNDYSGMFLRYLLDGRKFTITREITGLAPGEWYTMKMVLLDNSDANEVGIVGNARTTSFVGVGGASGFCTAEALVDFRATSSTETIYISGVSSGEEAPWELGYVFVEAVEVWRTTGPSVIYQDSYDYEDNFLAPPLAGWRTRQPDPGTAVQGTIQSVRFYGLTASETITAGALVSRRISGLIPGETYSARGSVSAGRDATGSGVHTPVTAAVTIETGDHQTFTGEGQGFDVTFVATSTTHEISLEIPADIALPVAAGGLYVGFASMVVTRERSTSLLPKPDSARPYRRTLYQVTAMSGVTVEEKYTKTAGSMMRVSFGLVAGVPDAYGEIDVVGSALGGTSSYVENLECNGGRPLRKNMIINPSFGINTAGWVAASAGTTLVASPTQRLANWAWPTVPGGRVYFGANAAGATTGILPVTGGITYTFSVVASLRSGTENPVQPWRISINYYAGSLSLGGGTVFYPPRGRTTDFRMAVTAAAPQGATSAALWVEIRGAKGGTAALARALFEQTGQAGTYFDGSYPNSTWDGAPNASTSTYTPADVDFLIDPDCPPLPSPPTPPQITDDCLVDVGAWQRYSIDILANQVPRASSAQPVVLVRTGDVAARQVRMRWYPNPERLAINQLDECAYEGEMSLSYVSPFTELTVNSIERRAYASQFSSGEVPATHLLYGPGGGPIQWPELRCNIPYIFAVDVDTDEDIGELDVVLSLGKKI